MIFTSGGTEADNLAIFGTVGTRGALGTVAGGPSPASGPSPPPGAPLVLAAAVEHHAVIESVERVGGEFVGVDRCGRNALDDLHERLGRSGPGAGGIVSVQLVNNETGVVQPLAAVADLVRSRRGDVVLHTDAVQAGTWLDVAAAVADFDLVSLSAHKIGGPKGVGALIARAGTGLEAQLVGGGQERGLRSGTQNVAGIVGFGAATAEVVATRAATLERVGRLRARLLDGLTAALPGRWRLTVAAELDVVEAVEVVEGIVNLCFPGVESEALLFLVDEAGLCASAGASCASGAVSLSHVLAAMGVDPEDGRGAVRLSLGWSTTEAEVDEAVGILAAAWARLGSPAVPHRPHDPVAARR